MKKIIVPFLFLLSTTSITAQKSKTDWDELNLKNKARSFIETTSYEESTRSGDTYINEKQETYFFNDKGYKIEYNWLNNKEPIQKTIYEYDLRDNIIKERDISSITTYEYDLNNHLINKARFNNAGILDFKTIYIYDLNGNLAEEKQNDGLKTIYKYDNKGNKTERYYYNYDGKLANKNTYKYDKDGNQIEMIDYDSYGGSKQIRRWTFKYDSKGHIIETFSYRDLTTLDSKTIYKFDEYGNPIQEITYSSNGHLMNRILYKYLFDNNMNWVKKTKYDGSQTQNYDRTYDYYIKEN